MKTTEHDRNKRDIDWYLTSWEGSRREQMRQWARLPLERAIMALEEMEVLAKTLHPDSDTRKEGEK